MPESLNLKTHGPAKPIEEALTHLEHALALVDEASPHSAVAARLQEVIDVIRDELHTA